MDSARTPSKLLIGSVSSLENFSNYLVELVLELLALLRCHAEGPDFSGESSTVVLPALLQISLQGRGIKDDRIGKLSFQGLFEHLDQVVSGLCRLKPHSHEKASWTRYELDGDGDGRESSDPQRTTGRH